MPGWTLVGDHPTQGRTFRRPLDVLELCYLWDGLFDGTADSVHHYQLSLQDGARHANLLSEENVVRAWLSTKRRFPLAGACVRGADGGLLQVELAPPDGDAGSGFASEPHFVVRERNLARVAPGEIEFGEVGGAEEARGRAEGLLHGPRPLSETLLAKLYVLREPEGPGHFRAHLIVALAHCVTDGTANRTLLRCLLDTLARGTDAEPFHAPLEQRLSAAVPWTERGPGWWQVLSPAVRRWRRAVGAVICRSRMANIQGGHTLPCRLTRSTWCTAARPGLVSTSLTAAQTDVVIANCRRHDLTFGNAFLALAQVAMTRVLYRRYLRGEISEEEWEHRKRQPHVNGGPLNMRRYLDETWFDNGGGGEFMLCISLYVYRLPFMTLGAALDSERRARVLLDGAPPFSELLTFERFLHRARLVQKQSKAFLSHPLLLEIIQATHFAYAQHPRQRALRWMQRRAEAANGHVTHGDAENKALAATDIPSIWAHGGSSLGNMDLIIPSEYPMRSTHPLSPYATAPHPAKAGYVAPRPSAPTEEADVSPTITVEDQRVYLHTRPAELFLGAATSGGRMELYVHYDGNIFEERVVGEWLDEVREAVLWYLCSTW